MILEEFIFNENRITENEEDIKIDEVKSYPVKVLWTPRTSDISSVLEFSCRYNLEKFLFQRSLIKEQLGKSKGKMGRIQFWE